MARSIPLFHFPFLFRKMHEEYPMQLWRVRKLFLKRLVFTALVLLLLVTAVQIARGPTLLALYYADEALCIKCGRTQATMDTQIFGMTSRRIGSFLPTPLTKYLASAHDECAHQCACLRKSEVQILNEWPPFLIDRSRSRGADFVKTPLFVSMVAATSRTNTSLASNLIDYVLTTDDTLVLTNLPQLLKSAKKAANYPPDNHDFKISPPRLAY
jgi:hypothetical protein